MGGRLRRRQDDDGAARSHHPSLRYPGNRQRLLPLQTAAETAEISLTLGAAGADPLWFEKPSVHPFVRLKDHPSAPTYPPQSVAASGGQGWPQGHRSSRRAASLRVARRNATLW